MDMHEVEGRLAALEAIAIPALHDFMEAWNGSAWASQRESVLASMLERIDAGDVPAPEPPQAREAMKASLRAMFTAPICRSGNPWPVLPRR